MSALSYEEVMASLPVNVRQAIEYHDADAFQCALDALPDEQVQQIVQQLQEIGVIGVGPVTEVEFQSMLKEFDLLIQAIVAVARGDESQRGQVLEVLPKLDQAGYHLGEAIPHLWAGERRAEVLTEGLDPNSARLLAHILALLVGEKMPKMLDDEVLATTIPPEVLAAIENQDETAFQQAMEALAPPERAFVAEQLAKMQARADAEAEAWLASLPVNVRLAVLDQDAQRLRAALQELPPSQAQEILDQLDAAGVLAELEEPQADLLMDEFEPLALAAAAVAQGNQNARPQVEALLADLDEQGWHLSQAVQRIWAGEREIGPLSQGLDRQDRQVIQRILDILLP